MTTTKTITYTIPGDYTWVCPANVTSATVKCWAGGGSGSDGIRFNTSDYYCGGSGGGGAFAQSTVDVTAANTYTLHVGSGGKIRWSLIGSTYGEDGTGSSFSFNGSNLVYADFGRGGIWDGVTGNASGGSTSNCIGTISYNGGNGLVDNLAHTHPNGGGGGAGSDASGTSAFSGYAGTGGSSFGGDGGIGGYIGLSAAGDGTAGFSFGGGGGGGGTSRNDGTGRGAPGGNGMVQLTFNLYNYVQNMVIKRAI